MTQQSFGQTRDPDITLVSAGCPEDLWIPNGPLALSAFLERHGYSTRFRDYQCCCDADLGKPDHFADWVLEDASEVVGISVVSSSLPLALLGIRLIKQRSPNRTILIGGSGVGAIDELIAREFPEVDAVVRGEGELTLLDLLHQLKGERDFQKVPGITFSDGDLVIRTEPRTRLVSLDPLPRPAYEKIDIASYDLQRFGDYLPLGVATTRGCPYQCAFCEVPGLWPGPLGQRSVPHVLEELAFLTERFGARSVYIIDDTFVADRERVFQFCDAISSSGLELSWACHGRVDRTDEELLSAVTEAGCERMLFGIESGSDRVLENIGKGFTVSEAFRALEDAVRYLSVEASFMWGFPFESLEDFYDTAIMMRRTKAMGVETKLSMLSAVPCSRLAREYGADIEEVPVWEVSGNLGLRRRPEDRCGLLDRYEYGSELLDLIRTHREMCSSFYSFKTPALEEKLDLLFLDHESAEKHAASNLNRTANSEDDKAPRSDSVNIGEQARLAIRTVAGKPYAIVLPRCIVYPLEEFLQAATRDDELRGLIVTFGAEHGFCFTEHELADELTGPSHPPTPVG